MSDYIDVLRFAVAVASMDLKMLADVNVPPEEVTTRMRRDMLSRIVQYTRITPELRARLPLVDLIARESMLTGAQMDEFRSALVKFFELELAIETVAHFPVVAAAIDAERARRNREYEYRSDAVRSTPEGRALYEKTMELPPTIEALADYQAAFKAVPYDETDSKSGGDTCRINPLPASHPIPRPYRSHP